MKTDCLQITDGALGCWSFFFHFHQIRRKMCLIKSGKTYSKLQNMPAIKITQYDEESVFQLYKSHCASLKVSPHWCLTSVSSALLTLPVFTAAFKLACEQSTTSLYQWTKDVRKFGPTKYFQNTTPSQCHAFTINPCVSITLRTPSTPRDAVTSFQPDVWTCGGSPAPWRHTKPVAESQR